MQRSLTRFCVRLILIVVLLSGCTQATQPGSTAVPAAPTSALATIMPTSDGFKVATATPAPTNANQPTGAAPQPTIGLGVTIVPATVVPTAAPPTATVSPAAALVGPEWTIAAIGDLNQDGLLDVVAYKPSAVVPRSPRPEFPFSASEIVIVQQGSAGPEVQLAANVGAVVVPGQQIAGFAAGGGPTGYMLQVGGGAIGIVPLNATGDVSMLGARLSWNPSVAGYRAQLLAGTPAPTVAGLALVGPEWQIISQTDLNANGRRDTIAFKPGPAVALQAGYAQSIAEAVIVEEGLLGRAELQLALNAQQLLIPGVVLTSYPAQIRPAGFFATLGQAGIPLNIAPFDATGKAITTGARIVWDATSASYRATSDSQLLPPPRALLGPEWTVAADGDANSDGVRDVVAYKPAGIQVRPPNPNYRLVAAEIVVVQQNAAGPYGDPEVQLAINNRQIVAPGVPLFNYATTDPNRAVGAFLLNVTPTGGSPVSIIPVTTAGAPLNDLATVAAWEPGIAAYRLRVTVQPTPLPQPIPTPIPAGNMVGPEWTILSSGDFNADGIRDVVAYKPIAIIPKAPNASLPLIVSELVIVQQGVTGAELQLAVGSTQIVVPGQSIRSFNPAAAGFQVGVDATRTGSIILIPLNASGDPIAQRVVISWNAARGLYLI